MFVLVSSADDYVMADTEVTCVLNIRRSKTQAMGGKRRRTFMKELTDGISDVGAKTAKSFFQLAWNAKKIRFVNGSEKACNSIMNETGGTF